MGFSERFFLVEEETDRLVRLPAARVQRWYHGKELATEFAGRTVRVLIVTCVTEARRVVDVARVYGRKLQFLADGRLDAQQQLHLAAERMELADAERRPPTRPLDVMPRIRRRQFEERADFPVTDAHMQALRRALFGAPR